MHLIFRNEFGSSLYRRRSAYQPQTIRFLARCLRSVLNGNFPTDAIFIDPFRLEWTRGAGSPASAYCVYATYATEDELLRITWITVQIFRRDHIWTFGTPFWTKSPLLGPFSGSKNRWDARTHARTDGRTNGHTHIDFWRRLHNKPLRAMIEG